MLQAIPELKDYLNTGNRKNQLGNFSPRVSFSWDPTKKNQTFVRGGFGIIYDRVTSFIGFQERKNSTWRTYNFTNPGTDGSGGAACARDRRPVRLAGADPHQARHEDAARAGRCRSASGTSSRASSASTSTTYASTWTTSTSSATRTTWTSDGDAERAQADGERTATSSSGTTSAQSDYSAFLVQGTWQRNKTRVNLAYTLGWYEGDFDTAALPNFALPVPVQPAAHDGRRAAPPRALGGQPDPVRLHAVDDHHGRQPASVQSAIDGRDVNLDNITGDDYTGGTLTTTGNRTARPSNTWDNWYRTVDVRLSRPLYTRDGKTISFSAEVFNLFNWSNNLSYGGTQFTATGAAVASFGVPTGSYAARQGQVGMRMDW